jgi:hypothetical protein
MKSIYVLFLFVLISTLSNAQNIAFDKKYKKISDFTKAKFVAERKSFGQPAKVWILPNYVLYAEGNIYPADTLSFDGNVLFYDKSKNVSAIRYYKDGVQVPLVYINPDLTKLDKPTDKFFSYYLISNKLGEFCAYKRNNLLPTEDKDIMIASGKILDTTSLTLDGIIYYYNPKGEVKDIKNYNKGVEKSFIATTTDLKEPYEIVKIMSHTSRDFENVDVELDVFKKKCIETGADGVVGIQVSLAATPSTEQSFGYTCLVIVGTIIKLKKKE